MSWKLEHALDERRQLARLGQAVNRHEKGICVCLHALDLLLSLRSMGFPLHLKLHLKLLGELSVGALLLLLCRRVLRRDEGEAVD